jgi:glyoxylase-like metal-dependent hydrolase (beta-lactamase superfamily II)
MLLQHDRFLHATGPVPFMVHRLTQPGFASVNTWAVETSDGLVAFDGQRSLSAGREVAQLLRALGKPLLAVLLTHPHPDHVGGLGEIMALNPDAPLLALARTAEVVAADAQGYFAASRQVLPGDYPEPGAMPRPTRLVSDGEAIQLAGLDLRLSEYRDVEAPCMLVTEVAGAGAVFAADMVEHGMTPFLVEGHVEGWLAALGRMEPALPAGATLYPGHGAAGAVPVLVAAQRAYLRRALALVAEGADDAAALAALGREFPGFEPVAAIPDLAARNLAVLGGR